MTAPSRFTWLSRLLHWLTAALVFAALFIGFVMVNSVASYAQLIVVHKTLGVLILVVMVVRVINRLTHHPPAWPSTIGTLEGKVVGLSEKLLYALLLLQPLIGWAMLSAADYPVVLVGGVRLPAILPQSDSLHTLLWDAHFYLAFIFFALILMHVAAALFHALVRRDGVFESMAPELSPALPHDQVAPAE